MPLGMRGAIAPTVCMATLVASQFFHGVAGAQPQTRSVAEFYRGKTISLVVSSSPGGGYDALSRVVARLFP